MGAGGDKPEVKARLKAFPALCLLSSWSVMMMSTSGCTLEENMRPQRLGTYHLLLACIFLFPGVVHLEGSVMMRSTLTPKKIKGEMVES